MKEEEEKEAITSEMVEEAIERAKKLTENMERKPLTEAENLDKYFLIRTLDLDETFRNYIFGCLYMYSEAAVSGKLKDLLVNILQLSMHMKELNKRDEMS